MDQLHSAFKSGGETCAGTLFLPASACAAPVIVMAHGFGMVADAGLPDFARQFCLAGYAVYLFDYRTFGASSGWPRHWVSPARQLQDWRAALAHVRSLPQIDAARVALWGVSFSGGHVLTLASRQERSAAVLALVPHVSAAASLAKIPPITLLRLAGRAVLDIIGRLVRHPVYACTIGRPGDLAALSSEECWDGYQKLLASGISVENKVLARVFFEAPWYSPIRKVAAIKIPVSIVAGEQDGVTPSAAAKRAAARIPQGEFSLFNGNHFDPLFDPVRTQVIAMQLDFLQRVMPASP